MKIAAYIIALTCFVQWVLIVSGLGGEPSLKAVAAHSAAMGVVALLAIARTMD